MPVRGFEKAGHAAILEMGIEEGEGLFAEPQRIRMARYVGMCQRQKHAGMIVGVLDRVGDRTVDVEGAYPAASCRSAASGHEVDAVGDEPVGRAVPTALLGDREGVDLAGLRAHALGLHQRRGVEAKRLVEAAIAFVDA